MLLITPQYHHIFPHTEGKCNLQSQVLRQAPPPPSYCLLDEDVVENLTDKTRSQDTALPPHTTYHMQSGKAVSKGRVLPITSSPK